MKYKDWLKFIRARPHRDLNEKVIVYIYGKPIGEIVFKEGVVISRKKYSVKDRNPKSIDIKMEVADGRGKNVA